MNYLKNLAVMILAVLLMTSCGDGYKTTDTGLEYKFYVQNDGEKPNIGDFITIDMFYGTDDTVLFDSERVPDGLTFPLDSSYFAGDLFEGLLLMSKGDSASFRMSADSFFLVIARQTELPGFVTPGSKMTFEVKLHDFMSAEEKEKKDAVELENRKQQAEEDLSAYLEENNITTEPLESGLIFIEHEKGKGRKPEADDMVSVNLTVKLLDGTKIFSTDDRGEPIEYQYGKDFDTRGLEEGVGMLQKGGKATLIVPHQIAHGAQARGQIIPPYATIVYDVELVNMRSKEEYDREREEEAAKQRAKQEQLKNSEKAQRDKYLADNNITVEPTASGLYYIETEEGTGMKAMAGNTVTVHYTGRLLDGTIFDSSVDRGEPLSFRLGAGEVIKGWDEGIALMNEGGKATLIIPSDIAYGSRDGGTIPPYSTLVFDVELLSVEENE
jgi:FKBP-type peptidyl-prolyl cis-trans isomerase